MIGITRSVQPFDEFSRRDYGRPNRDPRSGMLPPKLAQIMINLSRTQKTATLLDPFCGSGTIIQEALLMGYTQVIGSDISQSAVENTKTNLAWLKLKAQQLIVSNVAALAKHVPAQSIDAVVTEPYLGPPLLGNVPLEHIKNTLHTLAALYHDAFGAAELH